MAEPVYGEHELDALARVFMRAALDRLLAEMAADYAKDESIEEAQAVGE